MPQGMEVLPPCQSSTRLGPLVSPRTCPAAVANRCNGSNVHSECQHEVIDLTHVVRSLQLAYFDANIPEAGPRVVLGALAVALLAAGPAASHRWVCLALLIYCFL